MEARSPRLDVEGQTVYRSCSDGASNRQVTRWGYDVNLKRVWRYGVFGYGGFDPIRIELMEDCAFDDDEAKGKREGRLRMAWQAGTDIGLM